MQDKKELEITVSCGKHWNQCMDSGPVRDLIGRSGQSIETQGVEDQAEPILEPPQFASFVCSVHHNLAIDVERFELHMELSFIETNGIAKELNKHRISVNTLIPVDRNKGNKREVNPYEVIENIEPIARAIAGYHLSKQECLTLRGFLFPDISPKVNEYFGNIIESILKEQGYEVTVKTKDYYFPSPTSTELVAPAFGTGIAKRINPNRREDYNIILTFFARQKTQHQTLIQLELSKEPTEEQLKQLDSRFRGGLGPYGLQVLCLVLAECAANNRNPYFMLDVNKCLDLLGYTRNKRGIHRTKNREKFSETLEVLTWIKFVVEKREPPKASRKIADRRIRFTGPLLNITGRWEEWNIETGKPIMDGLKILIAPEIYKFIDHGWYTMMPHEFLKLDASKKQHAILLYVYISNQWRIGWHQYGGVISQPMHQILDGAGLLERLPKRRNQQRDFIRRIKEALKWLASKRNFWIAEVGVRKRGRDPLDEIVNITMARDHPLKTGMKKQTEAIANVDS